MPINIILSSFAGFIISEIIENLAKIEIKRQGMRIIETNIGKPTSSQGLSCWLLMNKYPNL